MKRALLLSVLLVGCTHHVRVENPYFRPAERHKAWVNGFLWNLVGGRVNVTEFCGDRPVAAIDTRKSFGNAIVGWLTLGIYTPMHVTVTCGEIRQSAFGQAAPPMAPQPVYVQPAPAYAPSQPPVYVIPQQPQYAVPPPGAVYAPPATAYAPVPVMPQRM